MTSKTISIILKAADKASTEFKRIGKAASVLGGDIAKAEKEQIRLNKAINDTKRLQGYRNNLGETAKKLAENRARQKELLAEMKKGGGATRQQTQEMNKLASEAKNLEKTQARQTKTAARLAKEMKAAGTSTVKLADSQKDLKTKLEKVNGTLEKQKKILEARNKAAALKARLGDAATRSATMMYTARGIADTTRNVLAAPVAAYAQSETASTDLRAAMMDSSGKVGADYQRIDELATRLGDKLPGTTADFKNLMTMLLRQGLSAKTVLGGTGEAAALLAVQLKKTPEEAAEMAAKLQDATRGTEKEMEAIMDQVQRLYYAGTDSNNILGAFTSLSPALDTLKIKGKAAMEQMSPLIGMLDQAGLSGEKSGNALRKVFTRMMNTAKVGKAAKAAGIQLDFTNGKGEFGGFENMYKQLAKLKSLSTEKQLKLLQSIFGDDSETLQALNTMIEKGKEGYDQFSKKLEAQASLRQRVNDQLGTLANLWDAASGTFTNFLAKMGESVAPQLKELTKWIGGINEKLSDWAAKNPQTAAAVMKTAAVIGVLLTAVVSIGAALSALLIPIALSKFAFFSLFGGMGKAAGGALGLAGTLLKLGGSLAAFGAKALVFFATNPFGWAILAVGALVMLWRNWDTVKSALIAGWEWVKKVFGGQNPIAVAISAAVNPIGTLIANFDRLKNAAVGAWEWIKKTTGIGSPTPAAPKTTAPKAPIVPPRGFSTGGYTGAGGVHEAAGIVHKGEVVFNQKDVARFGGWQVLDKIRKAGLDALGGLLPVAAPVAAPVLAGAIPVATDFNRAAPASAPAAGMTVNITVNGGSGSPAEIAREIARQLKQTADQAARRARSAFKDR
ncbi:phage tail tape measure protein [Neisseria meningitidis]|uniref:phage tail tape measure protein n=1 Tax=Neisseria meningitidis TaxID=487 RepID=UPI000766D896|nr:phage tail tape measure protein [Neisseria meningitidis]CWN46455.1 phage tail related protein [Neisseria meningitidis]CWR20013.1 phage tail related protein [Neisseria meningitidis]